MADVILKLWGVFPIDGKWGVYKHNLTTPERTFDERRFALEWAFENADPEDFSVIRVANDAHEKVVDWLRMPAGKALSDDTVLRLLNLKNKLQFSVEK